MPRGDKSSYTDRQKRMAGHIEEGYEDRGIGEGEAARRAWATVNKETHGGQTSGSGRGLKEDHSPARKGGRTGGGSSAARPASARSAAGKKAAATRKRNAAKGPAGKRSTTAKRAPAKTARKTSRTKTPARKTASRRTTKRSA